MDIRRGLAATLITFALAASGAAAEDEIKSVPKPGDQAGINQSIAIFSIARVEFDSPFAPGYAELTNPETASDPIYYTLSVSIAELLQKAGTTGYSDEAYAELSAKPDFTPEASYIELCQTEPIEPGGAVEVITLGALPDGSTLPAGEYMGNLVPVILKDQADDDEGSEDPDTVAARISLKMTAAIPFSVKTGLARLTADGEGRIQTRVFNPVSSGTDIVYSLQISQGEIERVSGDSHQTEAELMRQAQEANFNADYEFLSLFTSGAVAPGEFLTGAVLDALPDGQRLPSGEYTGWLVRYADSGNGELAALDVNTQVQLIIP